MSSDPNGNAGTDVAYDEEGIRDRAYEICRERGGEPGHELDDWLKAEREHQIQRVL
jgi:hypothetical protein